MDVAMNKQESKATLRLNKEAAIKYKTMIDKTPKMTESDLTANSESPHREIQ